MARVCCEEFPKGSYPGQKEDGFPLDDALKENLDLLPKNIVNDWDFTIIISGNGEVRVGKSVLGMQIGYYLHSQMKKLYNKNTIFTLQTNYAFSGAKLIPMGGELAKEHKYSSLVYDEAAADLDSKKLMTRKTKALIDYFRECGQYNLFNILIVPDFFELPKGIAITRSICLIDVQYFGNKEGIFERGYFNFYSRKQKKELYIKGKKFLDYNAARADFYGRFSNFYPLPEDEYRKLKLDALSARSFEEVSLSERVIKQRNAAFLCLRELLGLTYEEIADLITEKSGFRTPLTTVSDAIRMQEASKGTL